MNVSHIKNLIQSIFEFKVLYYEYVAGRLDMDTRYDNVIILVKNVSKSVKIFLMCSLGEHDKINA